MNISTFQEQNLSTRPTFFGCNDSSPVPLLIYIANGAPPPGQPAITNTSSGQSVYNSSEVQAMLDQTAIIATQGFPANTSETMDANWPACLACAIVERVRAKQNVTRIGICEDCFLRYCFTPTVNGSAQASQSSNARPIGRKHVLNQDHMLLVLSLTIVFLSFVV